MIYSLDTNIVIFAMKGERRLLARITRYRPEEVAISAVVVFELAFGIAKSSRQAQNRHRLEQFLSPFPLLDFSREDAREAGRVRAMLRRRGTPIGPYDLLIAGQALARGLTLVTANAEEFARVDGLSVEDWAAAAP